MDLMVKIFGVLTMATLTAIGLTSCEKEDVQVCEEETYISKVGWHRINSRDCDNYDYHDGIRNRFGDKQYDVWSYANEILECDPDFFERFESGDLVPSDAFSFNYLFGGCREINASGGGGTPGCLILEFVHETRNKCYYE